MEVDPLVMKALHHLVSRKPDSTEKLKKMLFESLGREYVPAQAVSISPWFISVHEILKDCPSNKWDNFFTFDLPV